MVIPREQRYSTKNGSGLDSLGHFLAFLLLFASSRCCFRRIDFVTASFLFPYFLSEITSTTLVCLILKMESPNPINTQTTNTNKIYPI